MKKLIAFIFILGLALTGQAQVSKTINITTSGTLSTALTSIELNTVTNLTITGAIDARDFVTMRDAMPELTNIDLSGTMITYYSGSAGPAGVKATVPNAKNTTIEPDFDHPLSIIHTQQVQLLVKATATTVYPANKIPTGAFDSNTLLKAISLPSSVTTIGSYAFYFCSGLTSITIPSSVSTIEESAFTYCRGLNSITIPTSVTSIGSYAFKGCTGLTSVIPASVTSIGSFAFNKCGLINVDTGNPNYSSQDGVLYNKTKTQLIQFITSKSNYIIPSSVTSIGSYAFYFCTDLTSITIPALVTSIGSYAFNGCTSLTSIYAHPVTPANLSDFDIFEDVNNCTLYVPIGSKAAYQAVFGWEYFFSNIVEKDFPVSKTIQLTAAGTLSVALTSDELATVTNLTITGTIDARDFKILRDAMPALTILDLRGVTVAANSGLAGPAGVKAFLSPAVITSAKTELDDPLNRIRAQQVKKQVGTVVTAAYPANEIPLFAFFNPSTGNGKIILTSVTLPLSATSIGSNAFSVCSGLTSVTIPSSVTSIGSQAFSYCSGLTSVTIPSSVTSIGDAAFYSCSGLTSVTIPSSVTSIGDAAFLSCSGLTSVTIPSSVTSIGSQVFSFCSGLTSINVENTNQNYSGTNGVLFDKNQINLIQYPGGKTGSYTIPSSVTTIGSYAFYNCSGLTSVSIPSSVASIGSYAFGSCKGLTSVTIPSSVTSIGSYAFYYCYGLMSVTIPSSVTSIGSGAFGYCYGLTSIYAYSTVPVNISASSSVFDHVNKTTCILYVPIGSKSLYQAAVQWKDFTNMTEFTTAVPTVTNESINIYPNPVTDGFRIKGLEGTSSLRLTDLNGKVLLQKQVVGNENVSVSKLPAGMYMINLSNNGVNYQKKFIKK